MSTSAVVSPITLAPSLDLLPLAPEPALAEITKPRKPRVWTLFATLLLVVVAGEVAVFLSAVAVGFGSGIVLGAMGTDQAVIQSQIQSIFQNPLVSVIVSLLPFQLAMATIVVLAARRSKEPVKQRLGWLAPSGRKFGIVKLTSLAAFTLSAALAVSILLVVFVSLPLPSSGVSAVVDGGSVWAILLLSVLMSIVPALVEETFFRGYLQRRFLERWSPVVAIGVTTLLFAIMHFDALTHVLAVIPLGIITGLLAYRTNSVKPGMVVHATHNVGTVLFSASVATFGPMVSDETLGLVIFGAIGILALLGLPAVISLMRSGKRVLATDSVQERSAETPTVIRREAIELDFGFDSKLASAV